MEKRKKIMIFSIIVLSLLCFLYFITRRPLKYIVDDFSKIHGDKYACAYEPDFFKVNFTDHTIDFRNANLDGDFVGGVALNGEKLFFTTINTDNEDYIFKIIESDYYLNNQKVIYEKRFNYKVGAFSYEKVIYFGERTYGNKTIDVEAYDTTTYGYLGIVSQSAGYDYYDYVSFKTINDPFKYVIVHFFSDNFVNIIKKKTQEEKTLNDENLEQDMVGKIILKQKKHFWSSGMWINEKLYLICSMPSKEYSLISSYFNVVYEYDFENDMLIFKFYFCSNDYTDLHLCFGYE